MHTTEDTVTSSPPEHTGALLRHFADSRDGSHAAPSPDRTRSASSPQPLRCSIPMPAKHCARSTRVSCSTPVRSPTPAFEALPRPASRPSGHSHGHSSERPGSSRSSFAPTSASDPPTRTSKAAPSATGHSTYSTSSRQRQSCRPCAQSRPQRSTTWCSRPEATTESFRCS
jgi:hypothetical protein